MARRVLKIGDVFSVILKDEKLKYFQYVGRDILQLNTQVIRVFKTEYSVNAQPDLSEIVKDDVDFVAHCVIKFGIKMNIWEFVGNIAYNEKLQTLFRDTNDYGSKPGEQIKVSNNWYIWKIGDINFNRVGYLLGENQLAEIGIVVTPIDILTRMQTGKYDFEYPAF